MKRQEKYIRTREDWYPTLEPNQKSPNPGKAFNNPHPWPVVAVSFVKLYLMPGETSPMYRTMAWGADDFGLELDTNNKKEAKQLFDKLKDFTSQAEMRRMGMYPA